MQTREGLIFRLSLVGIFRFEARAGQRITVSSKRGRAMLAMLACAPQGERSRRWLETILWCQRTEEQAKASLRKELFNLRKLLNTEEHELIGSDADTIWLDLEAIEVDLLAGTAKAGEQFLEGLDIAGEEAFEDWLRERRAEYAQAPLVPAVAAPLQNPPPAGSAPERPLDLAIAVLPFRLEPARQGQEHVAFGIGEELINRLGRLRWLPVIARSSSFALDEAMLDARAAGAALGARYIVEGTFSTHGERYRFLVSLADAKDGRSLWSETIELAALDDLASVEAALDGIIAALEHRVDQREQMLAVSAEGPSSDIMQLVWKARWHLAKLSEEGLKTASMLLDQAATTDPASPEILIEKTWFEIRKLWLRRGSHDEMRSLRRLAQKANLADSDDPRGYMLAGIAEFWLQNPERAETLLRRAIELNPSLVMAHAQLGGLLLHSGMPHDAIQSLETARNLSPNDQYLFYTEGELAMAHLAKGDFAKAIEHADASLARRTAYWSSHVAKINALVGFDDLAGARRAYEELMASQPRFRAHYIDWLPYQDISRNAALREGLNQVGRPTD